MPTLHRPWSTQYGDDFNKRKWKPPQYRKKSQICRPLKPKIPMATSIHIPHPPRAFAGPVYGLDDPYPTNIEDPEETQIPLVPHVHFDGIAHDLEILANENKIQAPPAPEMIPDADPKIPEPEELRTKSPELHWICWPEPKKSARRPHTSQGFHRQTTPKSPANPPGNEHIRNVGAPVTYQPAYQSWTNAADENERKSVEAMYALRRSHSFYEPSHKPMTSISINDPMPRDTYSGYGAGMPRSVDPRTIYQQSFFPYHKAGGAGPREAAVMQQLARGLNGSQPTDYNYNYSFNKYPLHLHRPRRASVSDDYVHDRSMFMTTNPNCVGHFIIHPDWVSERSALRRSNSMLSLRSSRKDGLRY